MFKIHHSKVFKESAINNKMEMGQLKQKMRKEDERIKEMPIDELVRKIQKDPEAMKQAKELIATC